MPEFKTLSDFFQQPTQAQTINTAVTKGKLGALADPSATQGLAGVFAGQGRDEKFKQQKEQKLKLFMPLYEKFIKKGNKKGLDNLLMAIKQDPHLKDIFPSDFEVEFKGDDVIGSDTVELKNGDIIFYKDGEAIRVDSGGTYTRKYNARPQKGEDKPKMQGISFKKLEEGESFEDNKSIGSFSRNEFGLSPAEMRKAGRGQELQAAFDKSVANRQGLGIEAKLEVKEIRKKKEDVKDLLTQIDQARKNLTVFATKTGESIGVKKNQTQLQQQSLIKMEAKLRKFIVPAEDAKKGDIIIGKDDNGADIYGIIVDNKGTVEKIL